MPGQRAKSTKKQQLKERPAKKKKVSNEETAFGGDFFLGSDDDEKNKHEDEEEQEVEETAEEKRVRLARTFLEQMKDDMGGELGRPGLHDDEDDEEDEDGLRDKMSERLKLDVAEAQGRLQRSIASPSLLPAADAPGPTWACRAHRLSITAIALTSDETTLFSVSKDGSIFKWDLATMKRTQLFRPGDRHKGPAQTGTTPDWIKAKARVGSAVALYAVAVSSDGKYLAVGGGDRKVYLFDAGSGAYLQAFPGHKDIVSGLVFRDGTHQLMSCSFDRQIKMWSVDDRAYMDTLYGHQAEILAMDMLRQERCVSAGQDHTCRVWKIPEESQLIFRAHNMSQDCVKYITGSEWVSGSCDGNLQLWSSMKKKPISIVRKAHGPKPGAAQPATLQVEAGEAAGAGTAPSIPDVAGWVQSVAVCRGTDLVASGAADGRIRLWQVEQSKQGGAHALLPLGDLACPGFINSLAISRSGRLLVAGVGQEPRLGRWWRNKASRNGIVVFKLNADAQVVEK